ncbi:MAG: polyprenyl synthetase family protein [Catenulispora sp.]|nr:polyprenyl synthetase family protein [Catenulispora sp.]
MQLIGAYHLGWVEADGSAADSSATDSSATDSSVAGGRKAGRGVPGARNGDDGGTAGAGRSGGGKLLRPGLVLAAAKAVAGPGTAGRAVLSAAAAVELAHNFTLLHDDLIDRDRTRRHRPTAWTVFGAENAILAGDAMLALALRLVAGELAGRLAECVIEICDGQYDDCAFEQRDDVTLDECLAMAGKKTAALLGCACALGASAVRAAPAAAAALEEFGREIGIAFQLTDDLLGIWGDPVTTGKPVGSDLTARKKSLPVVAALSAGTAASEELAELYALERNFTELELRRAADAVERAGGRTWAAAEATARVARAHAHLAKAPGINQAAVRDLRAIADLITRRTF